MRIQEQFALWEEHYEEPRPSSSTIYDLVNKSDDTK